MNLASNASYAASSWSVGGIILGACILAGVIAAFRSKAAKGRFAAIGVTAVLITIGTLAYHIHK